MYRFLLVPFQISAKLLQQKIYEDKKNIYVLYAYNLICMHFDAGCDDIF